MSKLSVCRLVAANDCVALPYLVARNVFAICSTRQDCAELLPESLVVLCLAHAFGLPFGVVEILVSRPCSLAFGESMTEIGETRQETTAVHDVLSLFRDKTVHDVMNPDRYPNKIAGECNTLVNADFEKYYV